MAATQGSAFTVPLMNSTGRLHSAVPTREQYEMYYGVMEAAGGVHQGDGDGRALGRRHLTLVVVAGTSDPLRLGRLGKGQEGGDHPARAPLEATALGIRLARRAVAHEDRRAFGQRARDVGAHRRPGTSPLEAALPAFAAPLPGGYRINFERSTGTSRTRMPVAR